MIGAGAHWRERPAIGDVAAARSRDRTSGTHKLEGRRPARAGAPPVLQPSFARDAFIACLRASCCRSRCSIRRCVNLIESGSRSLCFGSSLLPNQALCAGPLAPAPFFFSAPPPSPPKPLRMRRGARPRPTMRTRAANTRSSAVENAERQRRPYRHAGMRFALRMLTRTRNDRQKAHRETRL